MRLCAPLVLALGLIVSACSGATTPDGTPTTPDASAAVDDVAADDPADATSPDEADTAPDPLDAASCVDGEAGDVNQMAVYGHVRPETSDVGSPSPEPGERPRALQVGWGGGPRSDRLVFAAYLSAGCFGGVSSALEVG